MEEGITDNLLEDSHSWHDFNNTVSKMILQKGSNLECPRDGSHCNIIVNQLDGPCLNNTQDFSPDTECFVTIGECDTAIGRVLEIILMTMNCSELAEIKCAVRQCELYEKPGKDDQKILHFIFKIELIGFSPGSEIYETDSIAKFNQALHHKTKGVELFNNKQVFAAFYRFRKAIKLLIFISECDKKLDNKHTLLQISCRLNMAACQLLTEKYEEVVKNCNAVLIIDPDNLKAIYRRGVAYIHLQEYEKANVDLKRVSQREPNNAIVKKQLFILNEKIENLNSYYAKQMKKLFI